MADNKLLEEFADQNSGNLQRRLTDFFDIVLNIPDEEAVLKLRQELDVILLERINASGQD